MMRLGASVACCALLTLGGPCAAAQPSDEANAGLATTQEPEWGGRDEEARALFVAATHAYQGGHFDDAEDLFRRAYELSHRAALLYNVALAAERANHDRVALETYRAYLEQDPETNERERVEVRIAALEGLLEEAGPPPSPGPDPAPWIVFGASAAVLVAGVVMVGVAAADVAAVENAPMLSRWESVADAYGRSEPLSIAGFVAIGLGAVGAGIGLGWALAGSGDGGEQALELRVGPGMLALRGRLP